MRSRTENNVSHELNPKVESNNLGTCPRFSHFTFHIYFNIQFRLTLKKYIEAKSDGYEKEP